MTSDRLAWSGLLVALLLDAAAAAQSPPARDLGRAAAQEQEPVLARVGGRTITVDRFVEEMQLRAGPLPGQYATLEQRRQLLEEMVLAEALVEAAAGAGYQQDPEVVAVMEKAMVRKFLGDRLDRRLAEVRVGDEEVEAFYDEHEDAYSRPARSRAAIVFIAAPRTLAAERREAMRQRAEQALDEARSLPPDEPGFGEVARKYSDDRASRYQGGSIGWLVEQPGREYRWEAEVVDTLFALEHPGDLGPVVETEKGFYLVKLMDREESEAQPLESLRLGIEHRLVQERRTALRDDLYREILAGVGVEIDERLLESVEPPRAEPRQPPPLPELPAVKESPSPEGSSK